MDKKIPTAKLSRGAVVGKTLLKIGLKKSKRLLGSPKEKNNEEIADIILDAFGHLKGVSVKVAQQVAMGIPFMSNEYLEKIEKSFNQIPPINKALLRKVIKTELGSYSQDIFESFNSTPIGAASLGQVHLAIKDGKKLAVKIQYPGIANSIKSDITTLKFIIKRLAKGKDISHIVDEIENRLQEETNYEKEAINGEFFRNNIDSEYIIIPKIYPQLSTNRVLTTEFIDGLTLKEYLNSNPSQEEKNHYAQLMFDNFFYSMHKLNRLHADPNPGNFIFLKDKKLAIIDFGCVKELSKEFLKKDKALHIALLSKVSDEELLKYYKELNMIPQNSKEKMLEFYQEVIKPLDRVYTEPLLQDSYTFKESNELSKKAFNAILEVQKKQYNSINQLNQEYIFLDRTLFGYYSIFEKLNATIDTTYAKSLIGGKET